MGPLTPFLLNRAQEYIHKRLEEQLRKTGKIRALILKGRQQGCSTYTEGRFYHKATRFSGKSVFILSHEAQTTKKLFRIAERFQENCPNPVKPILTTQNRQEMIFAEIESEYTIGTAGNKDVGRGGTIQYFHGSEVAFWENTDGIVTGILQSVPDMEGTEIILESTANGMGNFFYTKCMQALNGESDFMLIFVPWFWQLEYTKVVPPDFVATEEELQMKYLYKLTTEQLAWRRAKIEEFTTTGRNGESKFKQEYPCNVIESFQTSGDSLIPADNIMAARKRNLDIRDVPKILGVDSGRNKDRSVIVWRHGRKIPKYRTYTAEETGGQETQWEMRLAGIIAKIIDLEDIDKVFIDCTKSYGTFDRLCEMGYKRIVVAVLFSERAIEHTLYLNKRVEMWMMLKLWFEGEVDVPDDDNFQKDISVVPDAVEMSTGVAKLVAKDTIVKNAGFSPDIGDAAVLTFAYPVKNQITEKFRKSNPKLQSRKKKSKHVLKTTQRVANGRF